jgi:hypothetical protein
VYVVAIVMQNRLQRPLLGWGKIELTRVKVAYLFLSISLDSKAIVLFNRIFIFLRRIENL